MAMKPGVSWAQLSLAPAREASSPRYLAAWLPAFALERLGFEAGEPAAVLAEQKSALRVVSCTPAAREAGVRPGMPAAEARARCPSLAEQPWSEAEEAADRAALVRALARWCDRVRAEPGEVVLMEISAVTTLYGGEEAVAERIAEQLGDFGHAAVVAVADHPRAAWALARAGVSGVVPMGQGAQALAACPILALGPSEALAEAWRTLGLAQVGQLARLDPASIAGRFGSEGVWLHAAARGLAGPPWSALPPPEPVEPVAVLLESPVEAVPALRPFLEQGLARLCEDLRARGRRLAAMELRLDLERGPAVRIPLRPARPTRDPVLLSDLLSERLGGIRLAAPVVALWAYVRDEVPGEGVQLGLLDRREGDLAWASLCARLRDVLGEACVVQPVLREAWLEEERWVAVPVGDPPPEVPEDPVDDPVAWQEAAAWRFPRPRPVRLRRVPLPVDVQEEEGRPVALRVAGGGWAPVHAARGPEVLEDGWWRPGGGARRRAWITRLPEGTAWMVQERGRWAVAGWF